jgi:hypothetical protein
MMNIMGRVGCKLQAKDLSTMWRRNFRERVDGMMRKMRLISK